MQIQFLRPIPEGHGHYKITVIDQQSGNHYSALTTFMPAIDILRDDDISEDEKLQTKIDLAEIVLRENGIIYHKLEINE